MIPQLAPYAKFVTATLGAAAIITTTFTGLPHWVPAALSAATAIAVYLVPNVTPPVPGQP